jgi:hypothetical protein
LRPVYGRLRIVAAQPADAEDLAQEFFARAMERGFDGYDPPRRASALSCGPAWTGLPPTRVGRSGGSSAAAV